MGSESESTCTGLLRVAGGTSERLARLSVVAVGVIAGGAVVLTTNGAAPLGLAVGGLCGLVLALVRSHENERQRLLAAVDAAHDEMRVALDARAAELARAERAEASARERVVELERTVAALERTLATREAPRFTMELGVDDYRELRDAVRRGEPHADLERRIEALAHEPGARALGRLADDARGEAVRRGVAAIDVVTEPTTLRFDSRRWKPVFEAMGHAITNAVEHGIEPAHERELLGKPGVPRLRFSAREVDGDVVVELRDDGRGLSWDAVARRAEALGLPCETREELAAALFTAGFSMRDGVHEAGGLPTLAAAARELDGRAELTSTEGMGTRVRVIVPTSRPVLVAVAS
jgi:hypothetical protein